MSDAKTEIKSDNNVEDASKVSDVPAVTSGTSSSSRVFMPWSGVCAAEASPPFPPRGHRGHGDARYVRAVSGRRRRRRRRTPPPQRLLRRSARPCGVARRATAPRASAPSPVGHPPARPAISRSCAVCTYVRTHAYPRVSRVVIGKDGGCFFTPRELSPTDRSVAPLVNFSFSFPLSPRACEPYDRRRAKRREIAATPRQERGRGRGRAMAIVGAAVRVRPGRRRRRPGTGVAREAYVCTTSETMRRWQNGGKLERDTASVQRSPIILSRERRNYRAVPYRVVSCPLLFLPP